MALAPTGYKTPLLLLLVLFSVTCSYGNQKQQSINSCGDNLNISFPFQLQGDPSNNTCNDYFYTLSCDENNRTVLPLLSGKYYVQSINYTDHSIRLVDVGIQTNNICSSFPLSSFNRSDFSPEGFIAYSSGRLVLFLSCEKPVQSPTYINRTRYCNTRDDSGNGNYSYVVAAKDVRVRDFADSCVLEVSYISTSRLIRKRGSNLSWLDLNKELGYGFDIPWGYSFCGDLSGCRKRASCFGDSVNVTAVCSDHEYCPQYYGGYDNFWTGNLWRDIVRDGVLPQSPIHSPHQAKATRLLTRSLSTPHTRGRRLLSPSATATPLSVGLSLCVSHLHGFIPTFVAQNRHWTSTNLSPNSSSPSGKALPY